MKAFLLLFAGFFVLVAEISSIDVSKNSPSIYLSYISTLFAGKEVGGIGKYTG